MYVQYQRWTDKALADYQSAENPHVTIGQLSADLQKACRSFLLR